MRVRVAITATITLFLAAMTVSSGEAASPDEVRIALLEAQRYFHQASNAEVSEEASELYRRALHRYEFALDKGGRRNARLLYNIANAYYRIGDIGNAILYYRRAQLRNPSDSNITHNLSVVRSKREDSFTGRGSEAVSRVLFFWHYLVPPTMKPYIFAAAFALGWIAAGIAVIRRNRAPFVAVVVFGVVALAMLGSLTVEELRLGAGDDGVIVSDEVVARKGDGTAYTASFVDPLHAGTEFELVEVRADWYRIRLVDGRTTWIPADSAKMVVPRGTS